jgi:YfiH family protein
MKPDKIAVDGSYLPVNWPGKADNVSAYTTLITGGYSTGDYGHFNLASHVDDDPSAVKANREKLKKDLNLPSEPVWLDQVHSNNVITVEEETAAVAGAILPVPQADACTTQMPGIVCVVLTADCLPVFFCNQAGTEVAVAHAGWRGLHRGVLSNTVKAMKSPAGELQVSMGPAIGPKVFEVGGEVKSAFIDKDDVNRNAFTAYGENHFLCDIYQLARNELLSIGVNSITGGDHCTYSEKHRFYSYRRNNATGRMASLIWRT